MKTTYCCLSFYLLAILNIILITNLQAQTECLGVRTQSGLKSASSSCARNSSCFLNYYQYQQNYIPNSNTPTKTIRLNLHIFQRTDPNNRGNFEQNNANHTSFLYSIIDKVNEIYAILAEPSDPRTDACGTNCYIADSKIRFQLMGIYYHQDDSYYGTLSNPEAIYSINANSEINIYDMGTENYIIGSYASTPGFNISSNLYIVTTDIYYAYTLNPQVKILQV